MWHRFKSFTWSAHHDSWAASLITAHPSHQRRLSFCLWFHTWIEFSVLTVLNAQFHKILQSHFEDQVVFVVFLLSWISSFIHRHFLACVMKYERKKNLTVFRPFFLWAIFSIHSEAWGSRKGLTLHVAHTTTHERTQGNTHTEKYPDIFTNANVYWVGGKF